MYKEFWIEIERCQRGDRVTANNTTSHREGAKHWKFEISHATAVTNVTLEYFGFLVSFLLILAKIIKVGGNVGSNV
jgi:hypothetical protein